MLPVQLVSSLALIAGHAKVVRKGAEVTSTEDSVLVGNLVLQSCRAVINYNCPRAVHRETNITVARVEEITACRTKKITSHQPHFSIFNSRICAK